MAFREIYQRQVALLVRVLPVIAEEREFALKGGTAINLFVRDMPRLSVDIDLTYLPLAPRPQSLTAIDAAMKRMATNIERSVSSEVREGGIGVRLCGDSHALADPAWRKLPSSSPRAGFDCLSSGGLHHRPLCS